MCVLFPARLVETALTICDHSGRSCRRIQDQPKPRAHCHRSGTLFGTYPATGSFSRSALNSKAGLLTPALGAVKLLVILVVLYGPSLAFYRIPSTGLSAVIIHTVANLVASPRQVYHYWRISPLELLIWFAAALVTIFPTIEDGTLQS